MTPSDGELVVGIDGGGSKTVLAAADRQGRLEALKIGGGTNPADQTDWRERLTTLVGLLGPAEKRVCAACLGLAGLSVLRRGGAEPHLAWLLPCPLALHSDVQVAFDGAFQDSPGVLIVAGTGSVAWAQAAGMPVRVGGWGSIGDEGSGYWIGRRAIALTTQALDERSDAREFAAALLAEMALPDRGPATALLHWVETRAHARSAIAGLARRVCVLADAGDPVAMALLHEAADELSRHVEAARRLAGAHHPWSYAGGLFASDTLLRRMNERLGPAISPALPPVGGAIWRAARLAGWNVDKTWLSSLAASLATAQ